MIDQNSSSILFQPARKLLNTPLFPQATKTNIFSCKKIKTLGLAETATLATLSRV